MPQTYPYKFSNKDQVFTGEPAVYKLHFGKKYFIWKGKTLKGSVEQNCYDIHKLMWSNNPNPGHVFMPVVDYAKKARVLFTTVEPVVQSSDARLIVKTERDLLWACHNDPLCLNTVFEPYIPKWLAEELGPGKPVKTTQNKAITATLAADDNNIPVTDKKPAVVKKNIPEKVNKLLSTYRKLNGQ